MTAGATKLLSSPAIWLFGVLLAFPFVVHAPWIVDIGFFTLMYATLAVSWNFFAGFSGYIWLGTMAFFGLGSYIFALHYQHETLHNGVVPFFVLVLVGLVAAIVAVPVGALVLRVRGGTFALVSLSLLFVAQEIAFNLKSVTAGVAGVALPLVPFGTANYDRPFYLAMLAFLALAMLTSEAIARGRLGLILRAVRDDEDRARGLGARTAIAKIIAFALSAGFAAIVGGLWAYYEGWIYPRFATDPSTMFATVLMVFLGGRGTRWGPIVGALLIAPPKQYLAYALGASNLYLVAYALVFLVVIIFFPRGIVPTVAHQVERHRRRSTPRVSFRAEADTHPTGG